MQDFNFRLGSVLKLRKRQEDAALSALAGSRLLLEREQAHQEELHREALRHDSLRRDLRRGQVDVSGLQDADRYREALSLAASTQSRRVTAAESVVEDCTRQHLVRRTEKKALERLRERRADEHQHAVQTVEQSMLDEVAVRNWRGERQ